MASPVRTLTSRPAHGQPPHFDTVAYTDLEVRALQGGIMIGRPTRNPGPIHNSVELILVYPLIQPSHHGQDAVRRLSAGHLLRHEAVTTRHFILAWHIIYA